MDPLMQMIASRLYQGDEGGVTGLVQAALELGLDAEHILSQGLIAGMDQVGRDFNAGELYAPDVLVAARAMHVGMDLLRPHLEISRDRRRSVCARHHPGRPARPRHELGQDGAGRGGA